MKYLNIILILIITTLLHSCAGALVFPTSEVTPGARITAKVTTDKYENTIFNIDVKYLAKPERLTPPQKIYIVWVDTKTMGVINLGRLYSRTPDRSTLKTLTPFKPKEIFITAEQTPYIKTPQGIEISRLKF